MADASESSKKSRNWLVRLLVSSKPTIPDPARDQAWDQRDARRARQYVLRNALLLVPIAGVALVAVNIAVQAHGNTDIALVIVQNLTPGSLALEVVLNLLNYAVLGSIGATVLVVTDGRYSPDLRKRVSNIGSILIILETILVPLAWAAVIAAFVLIYRYLHWRIFSRAKPVAKLTTTEEILHLTTPPLDAHLRNLWLSGRATLRAIGEDVPPSPIEADGAAPPSPLSLDDFAKQWNKRFAVISPKHQRGIQSLLFAAIVGFVGTYGLSAVLNPIHFGPLVAVSINHGASEAGYLLLGDGQHGVLLSRNEGSVRYITSADILHIRTCRVSPNWWTSSVWALSAVPHGLDCDTLPSP